MIRPYEREGTVAESPKPKSPIGISKQIQTPFSDNDTNLTTTTTTSYTFDAAPPNGAGDEKERNKDMEQAVTLPYDTIVSREGTDRDSPSSVVRKVQDETSATKSIADNLRIDIATLAHSSEMALFPLPSQEGCKGLELPLDLETFGDLSSVESWPSVESDDSYDTRMNKMMQRWVDLNGGFYNEEDCNGDNAKVDLVDNVLDHVILAAPDLEEAMEMFEQLSSIRPTVIGPLQGLGARTAHVGLDHNKYVEFIAPANDQPGPLGAELSILPPGVLTPYHYSIRSTEVSRLTEGYVYDVLGWDPDHIVMV
jgi:hypothetical protein